MSLKHSWRCANWSYNLISLSVFDFLQKSIPTEIRQKKSVLVIVKDKSTDLWGGVYLQNDFKNILCEIKPRSFQEASPDPRFFLRGQIFSLARSIRPHSFGAPELFPVAKLRIVSQTQHVSLKIASQPEYASKMSRRIPPRPSQLSPRLSRNSCRQARTRSRPPA